MFAHVVADRDIAEFQGVVGPLINMLGCRVRDTGSDSGADIMRRIQESVLETLPFQRGFIQAVAAMEGKLVNSQLPWNSALSVEYVSDANGPGYYPVSGPSASDDVIGFETLWGSRAPEFDVVLGVLVGQKNVEVQLGYWDGRYGLICDERFGKYVSNSCVSMAPREWRGTCMRNSHGYIEGSVFVSQLLRGPSWS